VQKFYLAMGREPVVATEVNVGWRADKHLVGLQPICLASDLESAPSKRMAL
jgi:hypothetical protein